MINLKTGYAKKDAISEQKIKEAFRFENSEAPYVINDVNYWLFGDLPEIIPDEYCGEDPSIMFNQQILKIKRHYETYQNDCYSGFLMPWFGTGVLASGFGTEVRYLPKMDPAVEMSAMVDANEIDALVMPDPCKDGQMPRVLSAIDYFKENCDLPVGVTDCQGPLTTALSIVGYENFAYWIYDYPEKIHKLMDMCATALIDWVKVQKKHAGLGLEEPGYIIGAKMPQGSGGIWISDDDSVIFSEEIYKEFVVPYNEKVLLAFGGGGIHYCGNSTQNKKNYSGTQGLTCLHNFHMDDFCAVKQTRDEMLENGIPFYICDFAPSDKRLPGYYDDLFSKLDQKGLVVVSYIAPTIALSNGKYEAYERDQLALGKRVKQIIEEKQKKHF
jgi:hypothetical protein